MTKTDLPQITDYQRLQCKLFTKFVIDTNESQYRLRGAGSREKIKDDILSGKIMECRIFNLLEMSEHKPTPIDFTIYSRRRKTFDADTVWDGKRIHIKSCKDNGKFPNSWLFQKTDPMIINPDNDMLALCVEKFVDGEDQSYAYFIDASEVVLDEPVVYQIRNTKVCVYEKDLPKQ